MRASSDFFVFSTVFGHAVNPFYYFKRKLTFILTIILSKTEYILAASNPQSWKLPNGIWVISKWITTNFGLTKHVLFLNVFYWFVLRHPIYGAEFIQELKRKGIGL